MGLVLEMDVIPINGPNWLLGLYSRVVRSGLGKTDSRLSSFWWDNRTYMPHEQIHQSM
jgi:hypothetical protein